MEASHTSNVSLIDLSAQFPFDIDDAIKKEICFEETLIISCDHFDGKSESYDSDCEDTTVSSASSQEVVEQPTSEIKDLVEEQPPPPVDDDDDDFHFYFYPDCKKPLPPQNSEASLMIVDGLPKENPAVKEKKLCTCVVDKRGKCICYVNLPCKCGAKTKLECTCKNLKEICICHEGDPMPVCTCDSSEICLCHPDGKIRPVCTCDLVDKPCICHPGKYPSPVCTCKHKPKFHFDKIKSIDDLSGEEYFPEEEISVETTEIFAEEVLEEGTGKNDGKSAGKEDGEDAGKNSGKEAGDGAGEGAGKGFGESIFGSSTSGELPCDCQKPEPPPRCFCLKGRKCVCKGGICICGIRHPCVCEPTSSHSISCKTEDNKSICDCPKLCTCEDPNNCKCFHPPPPYCTCGNRHNCKCFKSCTCEAPCTCDLAPQKPEECVCLDKSPKSDPKNALCTCERAKGIESSRKMKKKRAGKEGYRWCHDVDPRHTYFDYGYGLHDKVDYKEQEKERFKFLGLNDDEVAEVKADEEVCPVHGVKSEKKVEAPSYEKKVGRSSFNGSSAIGGMSISVESLGEDKDKFLVQIVSHSSKEGTKTGSKLVGILDCKLHTLEENRTEQITKKDKTREHRSYLAICDSGYYNKVTRICSDRDVVKRLYHDFKTSRNFLLEAANVIFLRYISLKKYCGNIKTETIMMDGIICESIYACLGVSQALVNNTPLSVVKVERHIIEPSGFIHQTLTVLTVKGYIVSHEWANNCYICHLDPLLSVIPEEDEIEAHAPLRERWREDLQLLSDYLNFKSSRYSECVRYLSWNAALTGIVRDYLQAILLIRPKDTINFTRQYFGSALTALDLPRDDYFDPETRKLRYFFFEK